MLVTSLRDRLGRDVVTAALVLATMLPCREATAGNGRSFFFGNEAAMTGGAGVALVRDAEAVWYNPAGIGGLDRGRLSLSGTAFQLRHYRAVDGLRAILPSGTYDQDIEGLTTGAVPTAVVTTRRATDMISWGLGVFVTQSEEMSMRLAYGRDEVIAGLATLFGGLHSGSGRYEQSMEIYSDSRTYHIGPSVGFGITDRLRLGLSLFVVYGSAFTTDQFVSRFALDGLEGLRDVFQTLQARRNASYVGITAAAAVQWEAVPGFHLGLVVRSPSFGVYRWGEAVLTSASAAPAQMAGGDWTIADSAQQEITDLDRLGFDMIAPVEVSLSAAYQGEGFWIGAEGAFSPPLHNEQYGVRRGWLWNAALGSRFRITDSLAGGVGLFTDVSPSESPIVHGTGRVDYVGLSVGGEYRTTFDVPGTTGDGGLVFSTVLAARYALGYGTISAVNFSFAADGTEQDSHEQRATMYAHEASLHLGTALYF